MTTVTNQAEVYAFWTVSRCQECQSTDTKCNGRRVSQPMVQYRKCRECGHTYKVIGRPV